MWELLPKLLASGGAGVALAVIYLYTSGTVIPGHVYRSKCDECDREREERKAANQLIFDTIPVLDRAKEQVVRVPHVAKEVVTTAAAVVADNGGRKERRK